MNLEYASNAALVTSVVVYLLAVTAHAAEWAAARRTPLEETVAERELARAHTGSGAAQRPAALPAPTAGHQSSFSFSRAEAARNSSGASSCF